MTALAILGVGIVFIFLSIGAVAFAFVSLLLLLPMLRSARRQKENNIVKWLAVCIVGGSAVILTPVSLYLMAATTIVYVLPAVTTLLR